VPCPAISRRALLVSSAAALACGRRKATGFPGYCFVANRGSRSIAAVDLDRFRVRTQIPLESAPSAIIARPDAVRPRAFALAPAAGAVYEIDAASLSVRRRARVGSQAVALRFSPAGDALWALCRDPSALVQIALDRLRPARRIPLPAPPDSFEVSIDGRAAVASLQARSISIVSLARGVVERVIAAGVEPSLLRFQPDGRQLIAGSAPERSLTIFDVPTGKTIVRLPLPIAPRHFCFDVVDGAEGGQLFVTGEGMDAVVVAFPYTTEIDRTVLAGHAPGPMAVTDTSPSYLLISNPGSNTVTVLDVDSRKLVAVVGVGQGPGQIVITPDQPQQYALVLDEMSGDMAVIRLVTFAEHWVHHYKSASLFMLIPVGEEPVAAAVVRVG
jgi:YVTN family beta-propeller protein